MAVIDSSLGEYYIGELKSSNRQECEGLEQAAVWEAEYVMDRIMGEDKWNKKNKDIALVFGIL